MEQKSIFVLAYVRTTPSETVENLNLQKEAIARYSLENGYLVVQYVEHISRPDNVFDFDWLSDILSQDQRIRLILAHTSDRLCSDSRIAPRLEAFLANRYNISIDTVIKPCLFSYKITG